MAVDYASRLLRGSGEKYSVIEKECLALVFGLKQFHHYLLGHQFKIYTDHKPLQWLQTHLENPRLCRWSLAIQEYDFEIVYRTGKNNVVADALSRSPNACMIQQTHPIDRQEVLESQKEDPILKEVFRCMKKRMRRLNFDIPKKECGYFRRIWPSIVIEGGLLARVIKDKITGVKKKILFIGRTLKKKVLHHFHDTPSAGHLCPRKTLERCEKEVFWPNMRFEVNEYCKNCLKCQEIKMTRFRPS